MVLRLDIPSSNLHIIGILTEIVIVSKLWLILLGLILLFSTISCYLFVLGRKVDGLQDVSILLLIWMLWILALLLNFEFDTLKTDPCGVTVYIHIKRMFAVGSTSLLLFWRYKLPYRRRIRHSLHPECVSSSLLGWHVAHAADSNDLLMLLMRWRRDVSLIILLKILVLAGGSYFRA